PALSLRPLPADLPIYSLTPPPRCLPAVLGDGPGARYAPPAMSVTPWSADAPIDLEERVGELLGREPRLGPKALVAALAELADQSQSPVAYLDRELRYRYVNPAYERLDRKSVV